MNGRGVTKRSKTFCARLNERVPARYEAMRTKGYTPRRCVFLLACSTALWLLMAQASVAQSLKLHGDLGIQYSDFRASHFEGVSNGRPGGTIRVGVAYLLGENDRFSVGAEVGVYTRRMKRSVDEYYFVNRFITSELPVFFRVRLNGYWFAEGGAALLVSAASQSSLQGTEANTRLKMGRGFQKYDLAPFIGGVYKLGDHFAVGARARFGLLPMFEFQTVGDFGEMNPRQTDLYSSTFEVFIRVSSF